MDSFWEKCTYHGRRGFFSIKRDAAHSRYIRHLPLQKCKGKLAFRGFFIMFIWVLEHRNVNRLCLEPIVFISITNFPRKYMLFGFTAHSKAP